MNNNLILSFLSKRNFYLLIFLSSIFLLGCAYYFQYVMHLEPCPLCITQRFFVLLVGLTGLVAFFHYRPSIFNQVIYPVLMIIFASAGAFFAGRMVWLQHLPEDQVPACGPSLEYILESFPIWQALEVLLRGNGDCAEVVWQFLGLSMPTWVLIAFIAYIFSGLIQVFRPNT